MLNPKDKTCFKPTLKLLFPFSISQIKTAYMHAPQPTRLAQICRFVTIASGNALLFVCLNTSVTQLLMKIINSVDY